MPHTSAASPLGVGPDVTIAATLDRAFYLDPDLFAMARERIFARTYLAVDRRPGRRGRAGLALAARDARRPARRAAAAGARDAAGVLRCLSNVCTHRGNLLVRAPCRAEQIRCGYHSRRFDLAGRMTFMPAFEQAKNFPSPSDHLPSVPFGQLGAQGFASIAPAGPIEAFLGDVQARLCWLPLSAFKPDPSRSRDYTFDAHWALYVENYLEGLHIPFVHPGLTQTLALDPGACR